jgi:hypothetical protein
LAAGAVKRFTDFIIFLIIYLKYSTKSPVLYWQNNLTLPKRDRKMHHFRIFILIQLLLLSAHFLYAQKKETSLFEKSKGKLSFPVCTIYGYNDIKCFDYGKLMPGNKNISFITDSAAEVRAIYNGKVYKIFTIENEYAVVTNFGDYYITYYPLKQTRLKKGDTVISGQPISKVGYLDNAHEINILISKSTNFIDPYKWFRW